MSNKCLDCGKKLSSIYAKRCGKCARSGKISSFWKGGKPKCLDCGKQLSSYNSKRCCSCSKLSKHLLNKTRKKLSKSKLGKNNPMYGKHLSEEHKQK